MRITGGILHKDFFIFNYLLATNNIILSTKGRGGGGGGEMKWAGDKQFENVSTE